MEDHDLVDLISNYALAILRCYDANPDVGMGMSVYGAVDEACGVVVQEAARWNSLEALRITPMPDHIKNAALDKAMTLRKR